VRGSVGHAHVFDVAAREEIAQVGTASIVTVAFTADNKQFVTSGETADIWNTADWKPATTQPITTQHGPPRVLSTDAGLVFGGFDGTLTLWEPNGLPTIARDLPGAAPTGGTFSPDGTWLAITSSDDTMTLYRARDLTRVRRLSISGAGTRGLLDATTPVAFSPDSRVLAIGDRFGNVQLYDAGSQQKNGPAIKTGKAAVVGLTFSPDGRSLVTTSTADTVNGAHVIDVASRRVRSLDPPRPFALAATFRADGKELIVTIGVGGAVQYPVSGGEIGRGTLLNVRGAAPETAAFSPDGTLLATGRVDGTLSFLDGGTKQQVGSSVPISSGLLATLSWSSDGTLVIVQDVNATNHLIDVGQRARIGEPLPGVGPARYGAGSFAPDGRRMVLPGPRGTTIWNLDVTQWPAKACTIAGRDLTPTEWNTYFSSAGAYRPTCR
jgi:WD40 repeat protein